MQTPCVVVAFALTCSVLHLNAQGADRGAPPATPTGLKATGELGQIRLDWDDNGEPDLAGYNVYRSLLPRGPYTRLGVDSTLVPIGSVWRYDDTGTDLGDSWRAPEFDDSGWASGPARLGYGDSDEATELFSGPESHNKYPTYYFRHTFSVGDPTVFTELSVLLQRDDGAVVYVNGVEVLRDNMPTGTITYNTSALGAVGGSDKNVFFKFILPPGSLVAGSNLIAVEIHQSSGAGSDIVFDLELSGLVASRTELLQTLPISATTGEKPQSKVWRHEGWWWSVLPDSSGTWLWRLDETAWTKVLQLSTRTGVRADCRAVDDVTHVLLFAGASTQVASLEFVPGQPGTYQLWSQRPGLVDVTLSTGVETATFDVDSTRRMWLASDAATEIEVRYSDPPYATWAGPVVLASGVSTDDVSVVTALPDNTVGVLWSNQVDQRFGFRVHLDGDDPAVWSADEVPASQSALDVGLGMADDHLNLAVASDTTLYAAVKTSFDTPGYPKIALLVRRPSGSWDPLYGLDEAGTRPVVVLNEVLGRLMVVYTSSEGYSDIVRRDSPTAAINLGVRQTLLQGGLNNAASTKQNYADELVVLASSSSAAAGIRMTFSTGAGVPVSEFVDTGVTPGQTYHYVVTAEDTFGRESDFSSEATAAHRSSNSSAGAPGALQSAGSCLNTRARPERAGHRCDP